MIRAQRWSPHPHVAFRDSVQVSKTSYYGAFCQSLTIPFHLDKRSANEFGSNSLLIFNLQSSSKHTHFQRPRNLEFGIWNLKFELGFKREVI
ncbi:hypothetical protein LWI28_010458 [Acer negundo]|uniref:Uncharacterized protein n=1 Tax=Acer negundo TaxID=4023 RepID=A0AAD5NEK5_ACENE|nr:hypothetical protein LWI28_010458 [Acer negundo]KAK4834183.1 hypothetical protein QYF36_018441 [Acer negundo]